MDWFLYDNSLRHERVKKLILNFDLLLLSPDAKGTVKETAYFGIKISYMHAHVLQGNWIFFQSQLYRKKIAPLTRSIGTVLVFLLVTKLSKHSAYQLKQFIIDFEAVIVN